VKKFFSESWLVLLLALIFATMLAGAEQVFGPQIDANKRNEIKDAVFAVVPETADVERMTIDRHTVFKCVGETGEISGWGLVGSGFGFQDKIRLVVGLSADTTTITGLKVVENTETPGLGNKIEDPKWAGQFQELDATEDVEVVKEDLTEDERLENNQVEAITGATISSDAVAAIANNIIDQVRPELKK
jgi:electron transport complex protein RnfG